ncbi:MAG: T9SS type A sorting domain-containing protein [Ignavibacteriae bacterium]|nr:T9SS type A sorting domain-containing protein [Ignavibacteriota bacterium]
MQRWFRLSTLLIALALAVTVGYAGPRVQVAGRIAPNEVRIFLQDSTYQINGTYTVAGTLIIEPGTEVIFFDNGRLIDSVGGRIIADSRMSAAYNGTTPSSIGLLEYSDPRYFLTSSVVQETNYNEKTIDGLLAYPGNFTNPSGYGKYNYIFNVLLDTVTKRIENLTSGSVLPGQGSNKVVISPMRAIMYTASRLWSTDDIIRFQPWRRLFGVTPNIPVNAATRRIVFRGQPINDYSREWGHIVVLPGARAAFFRDVDFKDFRKDTTVASTRPMYDTAIVEASLKSAYKVLNDDMQKLTNGAGGALTSFSERTWLIGCNFVNNLARFRGGALQMLQAPAGLGVYPDTAGMGITNYSFVDKNPSMTESDGSTIAQRVVQLSELDNINVPEPAISNSDAARQKVDDARHAIYLGRVRQLTFDNNRVLLSDVDTVRINGNRVVSDTDRPAALQSQSWKNEAFGGALVISGRELDENRKIEIGLGVNDSIRTAAGPFGFVSFGSKDFVTFINNHVTNRQFSPNSRGAKGGALYIGKYTSMIINGSFTNNYAETPYQANSNSDQYALGGAIFHENTLGRLQLRGHPSLGTEFVNNRAGSGGAVYVDGNTDPRPSPIIGGSDIPNPRLRDYGRRINFENNTAIAHGGAVFTKRNMTSYGAGGFINDLPLAQSYGTGFSIRFANNTSGLSGGAIAIHLPSIEPPVPIEQRYIRLVRTQFLNNTTGRFASSTGLEMLKQVRGGGAVYSMNGDLNVVKGVEFNNNSAFNSNGGAIAMIHPRTSSKRFFITDADQLTIQPNGTATAYISNDSLYDNRKIAAVAADVRSLTRFYNNIAEPNPDSRLLGSGATQMGANIIDIKRFHPGFIRDVLGNGLRENGIGMGGAIYILDSVTLNRRYRTDSVFLNRVRIQNNTAYTGSAVYSDNYDLKLVLTRCLVTSNRATSPVGRTQDVISGPFINPDNQASSDLAGATFYGDIIGPIPWTSFNIAANSIYDNDARFIIRLPDAPNSKSVLSGGAGIGFGGVDTLRGNYWGATQANVNTVIKTSQPGFVNGGIQETFFIQGNGNTHMRFLRTGRTDDTQQGPFEQNGFPGYTYTPIQIGKIPDTLLMAGRIYDFFDKGTDMKTADYSARRMSPIEDFSVGIPPKLQRYSNSTKASFNKYVRRLTKDPFATDSLNYATNRENVLWRQLRRLQTEFAPDYRTNEQSHPIGYPLFLEARARYQGEDINSNNDDPTTLNGSVFFVINDSTGDYIRINMNQFTDVQTLNNDGVYPKEILRGRVDFVPDSSERTGTSARVRRTYEGLYNFGGTETLLPRLADTAYNEDISALGGRKYDVFMSSALNKRGILYNNGQRVIYSNRPSMPASLASGSDTIVTYFAGERWNTLPVRPGDFVRVISRTVLWRDGVDTAIDKGLGFRITTSTPPPVFTGNKITTENPKVSAIYFSSYKNKIFVEEDESYSRVPDPNKKGRDSIFVISAIDSNLMYDPRWALDIDANGAIKPNDTTLKRYNQLEISWFPLYVGPYGDTVRDVFPNKLTALRRWITADTIWPTKNPKTITPRTPNPSYYGATGWVELKGKPSNPYVVPGGEWMEVVVKNYASSARIVDALKNIYLHSRADSSGNPTDSAFIVDTLSKFIYLYPSYFHAQKYDSDPIVSPPIGNARYLNQDTLNFGSSDSSVYRFMIFVMDSLPVFANTTRPSAACGLGTQQLLVANVTDKLRFYADFNTDDEKEDSVAANRENWDFKYGKTSYAFLSKSIRTTPGDTSIDEIYQVRPNWMVEQYMFREDVLLGDKATINIENTIDTQYAANVKILVNGFKDSTTVNIFQVDSIVTDVTVINNYSTSKVVKRDTVIDIRQRMTDNGPLIPIVLDTAVYLVDHVLSFSDKFGSDFTERGVANIRIPRAEALNLLKPLSPADQANGGLNTDTLITLVVNDGHGGLSYLTKRVFVNVSPTILNTSLDKAKEGLDYNTDLLNRPRKIEYFDPNFGQAQKFKLLYPTDADTMIAKDPCFREAGFWDVRGIKKTPKWLKINPVSGLLSGTPGIKDAPRSITLGNPDTVTVVITDAGGLNDVKTFILEVDSSNHDPKLLTAPIVRCIGDGDTYLDTLFAQDLDLLREKPWWDTSATFDPIIEEIRISIVSPTGTNLTIEPAAIRGTKVDTTQKVIIKSNGPFTFPANAVVDGKITIRVQITDGEVTKFLEYKLNISDPTDFLVPVTVSNNKDLGAFQVLYFGSAKNATTGEKADELGRLDSNYCEFELPPIPPRDVFDARWTIALRNGIIRNIFPTSVPKDANSSTYKARFQAGDITGSLSHAFPVTISWNRDDVPDKTNTTKNPSGATWWIRDNISNGNFFGYNMRTGQGAHASTIVDYDQSGSISTIRVNKDDIDGFIIIYDFISAVNEPETGMPTSFELGESNPNPSSGQSNMIMSIPTASNVKVEVYDAMGNKVKTLVDGFLSAGKTEIKWDAKNDAGVNMVSGVYFVKMTSGAFSTAQRMMLVR